VHELRACGLTDRAIYTRVESGRLFPKYRGVYALANPNIPFEGQLLAAAKACGPDAVVSHYSAGALRGWVRWDHRLPEITAPTARRHKGIKTHRSANVERTYYNGIPITPPIRTLIDLASILPYKALRRAVNEALNQGAIKPSDLLATNHRGARKLRQILATAAPTRNAFEDIVNALASEYGLPRPEVNRPFLGFVPDFRWPAQHVIVEADGVATHGHLLAQTDDAERQRFLEAHGETVLRVTWRQATMEPAQTARRIRDALFSFS
jgi:very-short-patch-repair endonuclease